MQKPVTKKESGHGGNDALGLAWSWSSVQGWRPRQEDAHIAMSPVSDSGEWSDAGLFAVLDGHGGPEVAQLVQRWLPKELVGQSSESEHHTPSALKKAFHKVDNFIGTPDGRKELRSLGRKLGKEDMVGCAAVACVVEPDTIIVANVGDCRAVLCRVGGEAVPLTKDHTADLPRERSRILAAGGWIEPEETPWGAIQHRVNGVLNLSRALGDMKFKKDPHLRSSEQIISGVPDIKTAKREMGDEFLILACDGVWESRSEQFVVDFLRNGLRKNGGGPDGATKVLEALLDSCLSPHPEKTRGLGCDNMTAMLMRFTKDVTKNQDSSKRKRSSNFKESVKEKARRSSDEVKHPKGQAEAVPETHKKKKRRKIRIKRDRENGQQENQEKDKKRKKQRSSDSSNSSSAPSDITR